MHELTTRKVYSQPSSLCTVCTLCLTPHSGVLGSNPVSNTAVVCVIAHQPPPHASFSLFVHGSQPVHPHSTECKSVLVRTQIAQMLTRVLTLYYPDCDCEIPSTSHVIRGHQGHPGSTNKTVTMSNPDPLHIATRVYLQ